MEPEPNGISVKQEDNVKQSPHYAERPVIIFELSRFIGRWAYQVFTSCEPFNINVISHQRIGSSSDSTAMPILAVRHSVAYDPHDCIHLKPTHKKKVHMSSI